MRVDAHQHFWDYRPESYPWIGDGMDALRRDYAPSDLAPLLDACGLDGSVAVQARQDEEETAWLLALSESNPRILGVVGWVDLRSEHAERSLRRLSERPRLVGLRHVAQDEPDDGFLAREDFQRGVARLAPLGLAYDILIYARQLPAALSLVERLPEQRFVVDHLAKPEIARGVVEPWAKQMRRLASFPNVSCKLSGLVTEADWKTWRPEDLKPYLDVVFESFGAERLMFGSDWPVCLLAASYAEVVAVVSDYLSSGAESARASIFGGHAAAFYRLEAPRHDR